MPNMFIVCINNHDKLVPNHAKMTRTEAELKSLLRKAVEVKQQHPMLSISIPVAIGVANFTNEESEFHTIQAPVYHMVSPPSQQLNNYFQLWYLIIDEYGSHRG